MGKFSALIQPAKEPEAFKVNFDAADRLNYAMRNMSEIDLIMESLFDLRKIERDVNSDMAAINVLKTSTDYKGIIDIISRGNVEAFERRLGISKSDLFNRSESGKRDVYISSLSEDVTNFISNLWDAIRKAVQQVYDWSTNLTGDNTFIGACKRQMASTDQALSGKAPITVTCDITDIESWKYQANEVLRLYAIVKEILATATQSIITGQLNENMLQDQLMGKMQRNNISNTKFEIADGPKSSSFIFSGIATSRKTIQDIGAQYSACKSIYESILGEIAAINTAIEGYAKNISAAQNQYKCNTDCAAVVSNISSATQFIVKAVISINNYVLGPITNHMTDIASKVGSAANTVQPEQTQQQAPQQPVQQPTQQQPQEQQVTDQQNQNQQ